MEAAYLNLVTSGNFRNLSAVDRIISAGCAGGIQKPENLRDYYVETSSFKLSDRMKLNSL